MKWFEMIAPLIGVILGWGLSEGGKVLANKRQDKRKLKKLLFYILELRYSISKDLNLQKDINEFCSRIIDKIKPEFAEEAYSETEFSKSLLQEIIKKHSTMINSMDYLEQNIDSVINDLAEVLPIFAYELSGKYNIKSRLKAIDNYLKEIEEYTDEQPPFDLKEWIKPKVTDNLLKDLDKNLKQIALKVGRKTWKSTSIKIIEMDKQDNSELDSFFDEFINKAGYKSLMK